MHRIKKLLILQLAVILVFSVITVMSSADANIPQGPIDNVDKDNGVNQIMEAGIEDKNFATAIYDAFVSANYFGDETKDVRQILGEYEGAIDAANRGIKSIYGIEWLKNATSIDLSNHPNAPTTSIRNEIGDLRPLSIEYIMQIAGITESEATRWYREEHNDNLEIDLSGNPISNYKECGGKLLIRINEDNVASFDGYYLNAIKTGAVDWSMDLKVDTPEIYKNDQRVKFSKDPLITQILANVTTVNNDIAINYDAFDNDIFEVDNIKEELGDVLLHIVFFSELAGDENKFNVDDVIKNINEKLVRRHPHVFGDSNVKDVDGILKQWDEIKKEEKSNDKNEFKSVLDNIPKSLPIMEKSYKLMKKAASVGFEYEHIDDSLKKIEEELEEVKEAYNDNDKYHLEEEIGDLIMTVLDFARMNKINPLNSLIRVNEKFTKRFNYVEESAFKMNKKLQDMTLDEMDKLWNEYKMKEREEK